MISEQSNQTVLLIDGHSLAFRGFYALPPEGFTTSAGQHTNALYGFISMLSTLVQKEQPDYIIAAFDEGKATFRHQQYPEYKAQRAKTPEEFKGQVELVRQLLSILGIPSISRTEFEADDIIATLATRAEEEGISALIATGDRDSFQLITDNVTVLYPMQGTSRIKRFTPAAVAEKYNVSPAQYPDTAALRGDPSDNLPGVPKVGEKTAAKWLNTYGTLDELLAHADEIKGKVGENLREHISDVERNAELTRMVRDVPLDLTFSDGKRITADRTALNKFFDEVEFGTRLRDRVAHIFVSPAEAVEASSSVPEITLSLSSLAAPQDDALHAGSVKDWLAQQNRIENENTHEQSPKDGDGGDLWSLVIEGNTAPCSGDVASLVIAAPTGAQLFVDPAGLSSADENTLKEWLADEAVPKAVHDAKAVMHALHGRGLTLGGVQCDTAIASYVVNPGQRAMDISAVAQRHLGLEMNDEESGQLTLLVIDSEEQLRHQCYLASQAAAVILLARQLRDELHRLGEWELFRTVEMPLIPLLWSMENAGIGVSTERLHDLEDEFRQQAALLEAEAYAAIGDDSVNLGSPKQLQKVLFDTLDMPKTKKTKTGYSTNAESLEMLYEKTGHPFLAALLGHRAATKLKTTVTGLISSVADDERIHSTFNQYITTTGRLSSTDPNLQNIPVRTDEGRRIRGAFQAGRHYEELLTADYSQIEMRVMAHLSQDSGLIDAFQKGEDLHSYVGSIAFGVPIGDVTPELRRRTKAMSYGLAYGLSPFGLARQLDIPVAEAKGFMESYFQRFGGVRDYLHRVVEVARKEGYTETMFGRRRYLPELTSTNRAVREAAERAALNAPIQGTAADIIKLAMLEVNKRLSASDLRSRVLLQVHDELVCEVAPGEREELTELVRSAMDEAVRLDVPLEVSVGSGVSWNDAAH